MCCASIFTASEAQLMPTSNSQFQPYSDTEVGIFIDNPDDNTEMQYKLITENRFEDVIFHLRESFFLDEPLSKAAGLCTRSAGNNESEHFYRKTLAENLSIMAVNDNDEIVGVILNSVAHPGYVEGLQKELEKSDDEHFKKVFTISFNQYLAANAFEKFNVDKIFIIQLLSVDSRFRRQGIGKELTRRAVCIANDNLFKVMISDCTGNFTQKISKSNGFELLSEFYYDKYTDELGNPILSVEHPHIKLDLVYKILN